MKTTALFLVSGAMAIFYFITYAAYSFYSLFPQEMAFALMVVFTVFTVIAAINYNRQVIALIELVGAYAIPFLLSEGSDEIMVLFGYMAIINIGILIIAFKKYWKPLYYSSFGLTLVSDYRILSIKNELTDYEFTTIGLPSSKYRFFRLLVKSDEKPNLIAAQIFNNEITNDMDQLTYWIPCATYFGYIRSI